MKRTLNNTVNLRESGLEIWFQAYSLMKSHHPMINPPVSRVMQHKNLLTVGQAIFEFFLILSPLNFEFE